MKHYKLMYPDHKLKHEPKETELQKQTKVFSASLNKIKKKLQTLTLCNVFLDSALILDFTVILQNCRFHYLDISFTQ